MITVTLENEGNMLRTELPKPLEDLFELCKNNGAYPHKAGMPQNNYLLIFSFSFSTSCSKRSLPLNTSQNLLSGFVMISYMVS